MKRFISILILAALLVGCGETAVTPETKDTTDSTDKTTDKNADKTTDDTKSCSTIVPVGPWFFIGGGGLLVLAAGALFLGKRKATARA